MANQSNAPRGTQATPARPDYNAGDARMVAEREQQARSRSAFEAQGLSMIMASAEGRAYMYSILEKCGVFQSSFTGNSETFMREGQRNVGLMIIADIMRSHDEAYLVMVREAKDRGARGFRPRTLKTEDTIDG